MSEDIRPEHLLRYRQGDTSSAHFRDDLENSLNGRVWLSPARNLKDKAEVRPRIIKSKPKIFCEQYRALASLLPDGHELCLPSTTPEAIREYQQRRHRWQYQVRALGPANLSIGCLTSGTAPNANFMWDNYAAKHTGYQLRFKRIPFTKQGDALLGKVHYSDKGRPLSDFELLRFEFQLNGFDSYSRDPEAWLGIIQSFAFCKRGRYCNEGEYRLVRLHAPAGVYENLEGYRLEKVTIGMYASGELREAIYSCIPATVAISEL